MNKEMCFKINSQELMLEQVLVDYNKIPVYFICKDNQEQYYVVLCTDIDNEKYIITKTEIIKLIKLLTQKITMRDLILSENEFWEVSAGESIEEDVCEQKNISLINLEDLPYDNSYFNVVTKSHKDFLSELEKLSFSQTDWSKIPGTSIKTNELDDYLLLGNSNNCFNKQIEFVETKSVEGTNLFYGRKVMISYNNGFEVIADSRESIIECHLKLENLMDSNGLVAA